MGPKVAEQTVGDPYHGQRQIVDFTEALLGNVGLVKGDELVKSRFIPFSVIPAEAGIQSFQAVLDPGVRRGDDMKDFLRVHQGRHSSNSGFRRKSAGSRSKTG
jgi:hypothetical protein